MSPLPKKAILSLNAYKPNFGLTNIKNQIRLSANENPLGCSPNISKMLRLQDLNRYPPQNSENLIKTIECSPENYGIIYKEIKKVIYIPNKIINFVI